MLARRRAGNVKVLHISLWDSDRRPVGAEGWGRREDRSAGKVQIFILYFLFPFSALPFFIAAIWNIFPHFFAVWGLHLKLFFFTVCYVTLSGEMVWRGGWVVPFTPRLFVFDQGREFSVQNAPNFGPLRLGPSDLGEPS